MSIQEARRPFFEEWASSWRPEICHTLINWPGSTVDGDYYNQELQAAWLAWNAALDSVCVVLPKRDGRNMYGTDVFEKNDMVEAIEAAGIRCEVKP